MSEYGKRAKAPCGHNGVHIISQYVQCTEGCDTNAEDFPSIEFCPMCGKSDVDLDFELDPMYYLYNPGAKRVNRRCHPCGHVWRA